jgi:hypothetical protein
MANLFAVDLIMRAFNLHIESNWVFVMLTSAALPLMTFSLSYISLRKRKGDA